jgi:cytochrome oxidase Cu insertion factor (SCO1/SenC/PrrC family)
VTTHINLKRSLLNRCAGGMLAVGLFAANAAGAEDTPSAAQLMDELMWNRGPIGGPFTFIDHNGKQRSSKEFADKLLVIYFGYTYCPDICPLDLMTIAAAIERLGALGAQTQPLFITVDPERDTPEQLALYVPSIHPRLVGFTGSLRDIRQVALAYKVYFAKVPGKRPDDYLIDHTSFVYFADHEGNHELSSAWYGH